MSIAEVHFIRDTYSAGWKFDKGTSPWTSAPDEMAKKTVVRRLFKMLPTSIEIRDAFAIDEDDDQHNAKIIDASYEVLPDAHDPTVMQAELAAEVPGEAIKTPADKAKTEADHRVAVAEFRKAMDNIRVLAQTKPAVRGANPDDILKVPVEEHMKWSADRLFAATDILMAWVKKAEGKQ